LDELKMPLLVTAGEHDVPYIRAAADYLAEHLPGVRKEVLPDAAHLANLDHPHAFQAIVKGFLEDLA
jgi:pimeloyl-ACP methyl ester carboxylesterase